MKAERRHELQDNELASWLGQHLEQLKPYARMVVAIFVLSLAVAVAGGWWMRDQAATVQMGWNEFYQAFSSRDSDKLKNVAERYAGTQVAIWARQAEADIQLT